jgi:hypothetical protein
MEDTLQFWADCDRFWEWVENPELTPESLEAYANTGILPKAKVARPPRDFNEPPPGDFKTGSVWFHPATGEMFVFNQGAWKSTCTLKLPKPGIDLQRVKDVAKLYGIHSYYQSLTHQFKFSTGDKCWVETVENIKKFTEVFTLENYFSQFTEEKRSYNTNTGTKVSANALPPSG